MKNQKHNRGCGWILYGVVAILAVHIILVVFWPSIVEHTKVEWQAPDNGLWYCKELEIQLCFQPDIEYILPETGQMDIHSYALIDGEPIMCIAFDHHGPYTLRVDNQDISDEFHCGENIFKGEFVSLDAQNYVVRNKSGDLFTFKRVAEFSLEEKSDYYQKEIDTYSGVQIVGEVRHIAIAVQKAKDLWKTELGIDSIKDEIVVAYDFTYDCWYISTTSQHPPMCLIDTKGNVIGVW